MEPKVNYFLVGSFVVVLGAAMVIGMCWLGKTTTAASMTDTKHLCGSPSPG
jgi:ABC-type transporter Mla subunit MlaD